MGAQSSVSERLNDRRKTEHHPKWLSQVEMNLKASDCSVKELIGRQNDKLSDCPASIPSVTGKTADVS